MRAMMDEIILQRVMVDPEVMAGKPVIRGTRIPVEVIVDMLAQGIGERAILAEYPRLQPDDIGASLTYTAENLGQR